jgi:hypothetical protein
MVYLKFQIVCLQEREELRALKSCQEKEKLREKYEYGKERKKKYRKVKKEKNVRMKKEEKEKRGVAIKR